MLGFVLPRSFTNGGIYRTAREQLARLYGDISITALPDVAFRFSDAETVVVLASARTYEQHRLHCAFVSKRDYGSFLRTGRPTWEDVEEVAALPGSIPSLWRNPLAKGLEEQLEAFPTLGQVADIHRGVEYTAPVTQHVSDNPERGFVRGLRNVDDSLEPYFIKGWTYLDADPSVMRTDAFRYPWQERKIIANAARFSRGPWRLMAAVDEEGLVCYQRFHGIWAKDDYPVELIAAILNGPIANVLLSVSETTRDNLIKNLNAIPLPELSGEDVETVCHLVRRYQHQAKAQDQLQVEEASPHSLIVQIDTLVLSGYRLPEWLNRDLMDYIGSVEHPRLKSNFVEQLRERHGKLVNKRFDSGLGSGEVQELSRINNLLDAAEASFYGPVIDALSAARTRLLTSRRKGSE